VNQRITISGTDEVAQALRKYGRDAEREIGKAVTATALLIQGDIRKAIQRGPKTGRVYVRGEGQNLSRTHRASAPGEAPATDTGTLVSSITFKQESRLTATVASRLAYATYLEFGTQRIAPRPSWVPAVEKMRPEFAKRIQAALRKVQP
jgi:HK97 gp10 family phage protein